MQKLEIGTRIYYTGDRANIEGEGAITVIHPHDKWGPESYNIALDDGRNLLGIYPSNFSGPGKRFWLLDDWEADRQRRITEMQADMLKIIERQKNRVTA